VVRWLPRGTTEEALETLSLPTGSRLAYDIGNNPVILFANEWAADYFPQTNPGITLSAQPVKIERE
jgi:peptide subunit release factor RF-3